jgi:hypothetical protein
MPSLHKMSIDPPYRTRLGDGRADVENSVSLETPTYTVIRLELERRVTEDGHWIGLRDILLYIYGWLPR